MCSASALRSGCPVINNEKPCQRALLSKKPVIGRIAPLHIGICLESRAHDARTYDFLTLETCRHTFKEDFRRSRAAISPYSLGKVVILRAEISYTPLSASGALCAVCCLTFRTWNNYIELGSKRRCVGYRQRSSRDSLIKISPSGCVCKCSQFCFVAFQCTDDMN